MTNAYKLGEKHDEILTDLAEKENRPKIFTLRMALELYANKSKKKQ